MLFVSIIGMATPPVVLVEYAWLIGYRGGGGKTLRTSYQHLTIRWDVIGAVDNGERSQHVEQNQEKMTSSPAAIWRNSRLTHS